MRIQLTEDPFFQANRDEPWRTRDKWPAMWVNTDELRSPPAVVAFRLLFSATQAHTTRIHVSADERYELFLDGERVGRGPERGDRLNWFFESYELSIEPGDHTLVARVWALGEGLRPHAQISMQPGFLLAAEGAANEMLSTGVADWQVKPMGGYRFVMPRTGPTGANVDVDGAAFVWGFHRGEGDGWVEAKRSEPAVNGQRYHGLPVPTHPLIPGPLPAMKEMPRSAGRVRHIETIEVDADEVYTVPIDAARHLAHEQEQWQAMLDGRGEVEIGAHETRRVLLDLDDYLCAYPELALRGGRGTTVQLQWAEALFEELPQNLGKRTPKKGHRDEIAGKYFLGVGDVFHPDGPSRVFDTLWWQSGRYVALLIHTGDEALTVERLTLRETRYPLELDSRFACDDERLASVVPMMVRTMQACSHETYMDCPYYEQLMYVGDTRLEVLTHHVMTRDDALPIKAVRTFDGSRVPSGLTQSRFPCHRMQVIPGFSLWWICMVHDLALWRGRQAVVAECLPGMRAVLDAFAQRVRPDDLFEPLNGWMFMDWCWPYGVPPRGADGPCGPHHWHLVYTLNRAAELERWTGSTRHAEAYEQWAQSLAEATHAAFFDARRGLYADDLEHANLSEHAQCLALLSGRAPAAPDRLGRAMREADDLTRTTIYFSHYLFEAHRMLGAMDAMFDRLGEWFELPAQGFRTTREKPEPSRSDCHAWGAHPLFHYFASILGIRPTTFGFDRVEVRPQLGPLGRAHGELVHPRGRIVVELAREDERIIGRIELPDSVEGMLHLGDQQVPLKSGEQSVELLCVGGVG